MTWLHRSKVFSGGREVPATKQRSTNSLNGGVPIWTYHNTLYKEEWAFHALVSLRDAVEIPEGDIAPCAKHLYGRYVTNAHFAPSTLNTWVSNWFYSTLLPILNRGSKIFFFLGVRDLLHLKALEVP